VRGVLVERFGVLPVVTDLPDPVAPPGGVVVRVEVTGLCRSDVHGWLGHDPGIRLPHVPGHEMVGVVESVGAGVTSYAGGERVTTPFVCACGRCPECRSGNAQVCRAQSQPGFTHWGSYAEKFVLHDAEVNLVPVPPGVDPDAAALLGCRFATAYRGLVQQAAVAPGERVLVVGCGGVGLSSVMIARSVGARVLAVDVSEAALAAAARFGAEETVAAHGRTPAEVVAEVRRRTGGDGVAVSVDARGSEETLSVAIRSLAARGRHVQIGLLADDPVVPVPEVIARELTLLGTHGMAAAGYPALVDAVSSGSLRPQDLVEQRIRLDDVPAAMVAMSRDELPGVTVVDLR
jgi:D-arabinose 1-dehydrogenase-like Zn-dependent alcohol dehydrogenase